MRQIPVMSWQDPNQFRHFDPNHMFTEFPAHDLDYFRSHPSGFPTWDSGYQYLSDSLDPHAAAVLSTNEWTQFDNSQAVTYNAEAIAGITPANESQPVVTEPSDEERELRELKQQVSQLKESVEALQKT